MTDLNKNKPVNPLFTASARTPAAPPSSRTTARRAARIGGYGGAAVAAWLVTAVATGYGVASADMTETSSGSISTSEAPPDGDSTASDDDATTTGGDDATADDTTADEEATADETLEDDALDDETLEDDATADDETLDDDATADDETLDDDATADDETLDDDATADDETLEDAANDNTDADNTGVDNTPTTPTTVAPAATMTTATTQDELEAEAVEVESEGGPTAALVAESAEDGGGEAAAVAEEPTETTFEMARFSAAANDSVAPSTQVSTPITGFGGFLNSIVTKLLNPFLGPAPDSDKPFTPIIWAVLGWVRRELFNQAPVIAYDRELTVQNGQTLAGNIGAVDPEGDALRYKVTQAPRYGTLTIDQATGDFTYTPYDINYTAPQTDSFTVSVTDKKFNLLSFLRPHRDVEAIGLTVLNPTVERVILTEADLGVDYPWTPRFSADGTQIYFTGTPLDGTRSELHVVNVDGTGVQCLTCGLSPEVTQDLFKAVPTYDGSGRVLVQVETGLAASAMIYEPGGYEGNSSARLVPIIPPPSNPAAGEPNGYVLGVSPLQEPRISPDGQHILFNRLGANGLPPQFGGDGYFGVVPVVGELQRTTNATTGQIEYVIVDPVVIAAAGESKNWTPDGKGVICLCGLNEQGNADNVIIDLATGEVTRLNGNLDYDEDMDLSPNQQWMAVGSLRSFDGLTPATRIVRPATLPFYIQGAVYTQYALPLNISNQEWLVAVEDDLKRENGIPLFVQGDGLPGEPNGDDWTARSMPGWNADGTAVVFWEYDLNNPNEDARLVIANVKYTTSVGTITDRSTPDLWVPDPDNVEPGKFQFQPLKTYVLGPPPLPPTGTYQGVGGGSYTITEKDDPDTVNRAGYTVRTVTYDNYNNGDGMILNGSESTSSKAGLNTVYYLADIDVTDAVTGENRGYVRGDARINTLQRSITPTTPDDPATPDINESSMIRSSLDGDLLYLLDQQRYQLNLAEQ